MKKILSLIVTAMLCFATVLGTVGCGGSGGNSGAVKFIVYTGGGALDDAYRIEKNFSDYVYEKLGFEVELEYVGYNSYVETIGRYFTANEYFDMCYMGSQVTGLTYSSYAQAGYLKDITKDLPKYAPDLYNSMSEDIWAAAKVNGKIYGAINEQILARSVGIGIRTDVADAIGLTQEKIDSENITWQDAIRRAMTYIQNDPVLSPNGVVPSTTLVLGHDMWECLVMQANNMDALGADSSWPGVIEQGSTTVKNQYASAAYKQLAEFCVECWNNGWISTSQESSPVTSNQIVRSCGTYYPDVAENELYTSIGSDFEVFQFSDPLLTTTSVTTTMTCISTVSTKTKECLQLMNLIYKDQYLYNLLAIGEEDIEYKWVTGYDENDKEYRYISYIKESKYKPFADWAVGSQLNVYRKRGFAENWDDVIREINRTATKSTAYGFCYVPSSNKIQSAISTASEIAQRYTSQFINGKYDKTKTVDQIIAALNAELKPYLDTIINDKQTQLNKFLAK